MVGGFEAMSRLWTVGPGEKKALTGRREWKVDVDKDVWKWGQK